MWPSMVSNNWCDQITVKYVKTLYSGHCLSLTVVMGGYLGAVCVGTACLRNLVNGRLLILYKAIFFSQGPPGTGKTSLCKALAQKLSIRLSDR